MTYLQIAGFSASILIGVSLGLIGGGGSILTLPVLVYLLGVNPVLSTAYSLFVVGTTSLVGAINNMRQRQVDFRAAAVFAIPSFLSVFLTRRYLLPAIPDQIVLTDTLSISKDAAVMVFFALIMLAAAFSMIRDKRSGTDTPDEAPGFNLPLIAAQGLLVGALTGIVGAGGGFLIIPALVLLARLPMKKAVGTSLLIIAANSLVGLLGDDTTMKLDWPFLLTFTTLSVLGIFLGTYLARYISGEKLEESIRLVCPGDGRVHYWLRIFRIAYRTDFLSTYTVRLYLFSN